MSHLYLGNVENPTILNEIWSNFLAQDSSLYHTTTILIGTILFLNSFGRGISCSREQGWPVLSNRSLRVIFGVAFWIAERLNHGPLRFFRISIHSNKILNSNNSAVYERWVQQIFDPVLVARSWVSATKWGPLAKLWAVEKNKHGHLKVAVWEIIKTSCCKWQS